MERRFFSTIQHLEKMIRFCSVLILMAIGFCVNAQNDDYPYPSLSPKGKITQVVGNTTIEVEYERPSARKRQVFGSLVPWNKVWRTGAGHCTKIRFSKDVVVEGQAVAAGSYSLFTIPDPDEWIVMLNKDTTLYGSSYYDPKKDVARFVVIPTPSGRFYETLNVDLEMLPNDAKLYLSWTDVQLSFEIKTTTDSEIEAFIHSELRTRKNKDSNIYAGAAEYLFYQGDHLLEAITLAEHAIQLDPNNGWARNLKVRLYERLKLYDQALLEIQGAIRSIESGNYENEQDRENDLREFRSYYERIKRLNK
jgi:tetratricopeptide (TPR) repeat protein